MSTRITLKGPSPKTPAKGSTSTLRPPRPLGDPEGALQEAPRAITAKEAKLNAAMRDHRPHDLDRAVPKGCIFIRAAEMKSLAEACGVVGRTKRTVAKKLIALARVEDYCPAVSLSREASGTMFIDGPYCPGRTLKPRGYIFREEDAAKLRALPQRIASRKRPKSSTEVP